MCSGVSSRRRAPPPPPSRVPAKVPPSAPVHASPASSAVGAAQPRQPGLFGQMASTAVGVGIGSAVVSCAICCCHSFGRSFNAAN